MKLTKPSIGSKYNKLTIVSEPFKKSNKGEYFITCKCDCGITKDIRKSDVINGHSKSCGCNQYQPMINAKTTHNKTKSPEYKAWQNMKNRCYNPKHKQYKDYGERKITVCDEWLKSFETFYEDMGNKPSANHTLERINNNKGYSKNNCCWETRNTQNSNRRTPKHNKSGVKGVTKQVQRYKDKESIYWIATLTINKKKIYGGCYTNKKDAIKARKKLEEENLK